MWQFVRAIDNFGTDFQRENSCLPAALLCLYEKQKRGYMNTPNPGCDLG
jgi:hypothetical protein